MAELKPCPFCGEEAEYVSSDQGRVFVKCKYLFCGARGPAVLVSDCYAAKDKAIEAWNRRAEDVAD